MNAIAPSTQSNPPVSWRKVHALGRHERTIEMALAADHLNQESILQFFRDLLLYNLREAFMMAPDAPKAFALALTKFL